MTNGIETVSLLFNIRTSHEQISANQPGIYSTKGKQRTVEFIREVRLDYAFSSRYAQ